MMNENKQKMVKSSYLLSEMRSFVPQRFHIAPHHSQSKQDSFMNQRDNCSISTMHKSITLFQGGWNHNISRPSKKEKKGLLKRQKNALQKTSSSISSTARTTQAFSATLSNETP